MKPRQFAATAIITGVMLSLLVAVPARADGIPPDALPACGEFGDRGGWGVRNFTAYGTDNTITGTPVRPRNITLGEPCAADDGWQIPLKMDEVVGSSDDLDDIWNPATTPSCDSHNDVVTGGTIYAADVDAATDACDSLTLADLDTPPYGDPGYVVTGLSASIVSGKARVVWDNASSGDPGDGGALFLFCRNPTTLVLESTAWDGFFLYGGETATHVDLSCGPTYTEPWAVVAGSRIDYPNRKWGVVWKADGTPPAEGGPGTILGYQSSRITIGEKAEPDLVPPATSTGYFECSSTRTGSTAQLPLYQTYLFLESTETAEEADWTVHQTTLRGVPYRSAPGVTTWSRQFNMDFGVPVAACLYLTKVVLTVCVWVEISPTGYSCTTTEWLFSEWSKHPQYVEPTPYESICDHVTAGGLDAPCQPVLYPEYKDYSLAENACPDPPTPAWLDFGWLPAFVAYYAQCLFIPQGGADAGGWVKKAVAQSAIGQLTPILSDLATSFTFSSDCGIIAAGTAAETPYALNTCDLEPMAAVKPFLAGALWLGAGGWFIWFIVQTIIGLVNRRTPNPLGDGE